MHVLVEPSFKTSHWCTQYIKGITLQTKRKNMPVEIHTDIQFIHDPSFDDTHVIMLGSSLSWASNYMTRRHPSDRALDRQLPEDVSLCDLYRHGL